jgi:photosystem II stability/assembly factor-like uncharacterized protein
MSSPGGVRRLLTAGGVVLAALGLAGLVAAYGSVRLSLAEPGRKASTESGLGLAVDPEDGSLVRVGGVLSRSTDQGQTWVPLPIPDALKPERLIQVATSSAAPSSLYAAGPGAGVVRSDDRGQTWRQIGSGLPSDQIGAFAVHSFRPDTVYAWIDGQGVFRSEDGGAHWQKMDDGPSGIVTALAHSTLEGSMNTGWLYAATSAGPYLSMDCF